MCSYSILCCFYSVEHHRVHYVCPCKLSSQGCCWPWLLHAKEQSEDRCSTTASAGYGVGVWLAGSQQFSHSLPLHVRSVHTAKCRLYRPNTSHLQQEGMSHIWVNLFLGMRILLGNNNFLILKTNSRQNINSVLWKFSIPAVSTI